MPEKISHKVWQAAERFDSECRDEIKQVKSNTHYSYDPIIMKLNNEKIEEENSSPSGFEPRKNKVSLSSK